MKTLACALALVSFLVAPVAFAQPRTQGQQPTTVYGEDAFTDDLVRGDLQRPDGDMTRGRRRRPMPSLLTIRTHFVNEMLKSVENQ